MKSVYIISYIKRKLHRFTFNACQQNAFVKHIWSFFRMFSLQKNTFVNQSICWVIMVRVKQLKAMCVGCDPLTYRFEEDDACEHLLKSEISCIWVEVMGDCCAIGTSVKATHNMSADSNNINISFLCIWSEVSRVRDVICRLADMLLLWQ